MLNQSPPDKHALSTLKRLKPVLRLKNVHGRALVGVL
jgi:hypothetical protein